MNAEMLAAYVDGQVDAAQRSQVEAHLADCEECYEAFSEVARTGSDPHYVATASPARLGRPISRWLAAAAFLFAASGAFWWWQSPTRRIDAAVTLLAEAKRPARFSVGRLSIDQSWSAPPSATRGAARPKSPLEVREATVAVERAAASTTTAQALHALGLAHLAAGDVTDAVASFQDAIALDAASTSPAFEADLSASLIDRYFASGDAADATRALDSADVALRQSAAYGPALFNRALALEVLGPRSLAAEAWQTFLQHETRTEWVDEARHHLEAMKSPSAEAGAKTTALFHSIEQTSLPAWVAASGADRHVRLNQLGGDWRSLEATSDIELTQLLGALLREPSPSPARLDCQRDAVSGLVDWHQDYEQLDSDGGSRAAERQARGLTCLGLSEVGAAIERALLKDRNEVYDELGGLADKAEARGFLRKAALARISLGNTALRRTDLSTALAMLHRAFDLASKAGDLELGATASAMLGDAYRQHGDESHAWAELQHALGWLPAVDSPRLTYSILRACADEARLEGYLAASLSYSKLVEERAAIWKYPGALAYAHLERADAFGKLSAPADAERELQAAKASIDELRAAPIRDELANEFHALTGQLDSSQRPAEALTPLSLALEYFAAHHTTFRMAGVLLDRGRAYLKLGRQTDAERDWGEGAALIEDQQPIVRDEQLRISRFSSLWDVYAELIHAQRQHPAEALKIAEHARSRELLDSLARDQPLGRFAPVGGSDLWSWIPSGTTAIVFCALPDELLRWTVRADGVSVRELPISQQRLDVLVRQTVADLRRGGRGAGAELGDLLLDGLDVPVSTTRVVVVPDGALHFLPFAALPSRADGRFLVERWELVTAPTLSAARALFAAGSQPMLGAVVLAGYGATGVEDLPPLPGVDAELRELQGIYPDATVLSGGAATPTAVLAQARVSRIVHIASHAVINAAYPSRSHLVLAPTDGVAEAGALLSDQIAVSRLEGRPVVVLSGCDTAIGRAYRGEGALSLARPFLIAGASAVIAADWPLSDRDTPAVVAAIHRALGRNETPAAALASAQRQAIRAGVATNLWASFVVFGGF